MAIKDTHSKIIKNVAGPILRPHGFIQKGTSRLWYIDHGWKMTLIEFQPFSGRRGTFLNVAMMWLWAEKAYYCYDVGARGINETRVADFVEYIDDEQFTQACAHLVNQAVIECGELQKKLSTITDVGKYYSYETEKSEHDFYNSAVALGLDGKLEAAKANFTYILQSPHDVHWVQEMKKDAQRLLAITNTPDFKAAITEIILKTRKNLKLPELSIEFKTE